MRQDKTDDLEILFDLDEFYEDLSELTCPKRRPRLPFKSPASSDPLRNRSSRLSRNRWGSSSPSRWTNRSRNSPSNTIRLRASARSTSETRFIVRLEQLGPVIQSYHDQLQAHLVSYRKVKSRYSIRCDSYRSGRTLLAKMAVGGRRSNSTSRSTPTTRRSPQANITRATSATQRRTRMSRSCCPSAPNSRCARRCASSTI